MVLFKHILYQLLSYTISNLIICLQINYWDNRLFEYKLFYDKVQLNLLDNESKIVIKLNYRYFWGETKIWIGFRYPKLEN